MKNKIKNHANNIYGDEQFHQANNKWDITHTKNTQEETKKETNKQN